MGDPLEIVNNYKAVALCKAMEKSHDEAWEAKALLRALDINIWYDND
jgi:hypothetical protein